MFHYICGEPLPRLACQAPSSARERTPLLAIDAAQVRLHRLRAHEQPCRHLTVGETRRNEFCYAALRFLVHDDVMDRSPLRRGEPTTFQRLAGTDGLRSDAGRFGEAAAILGGDLAMALADELWWSSGFDPDRQRPAARIYHDMRAEVIGGQYLDVLASARRAATPEETRQISVLKSGRYTVERRDRRRAHRRRARALVSLAAEAPIRDL